MSAMIQVAKRYAQTLFDLALERKNLEDIQQALSDIKKIIDHVGDFCQFLGNPLLSFDERKQVLKALFEEKIISDVYQFLLFVTHKNRLNILEEIIEAFDSLYLTYTHQIRAWVTTAFPVEEGDKNILKQSLEDKFQGPVLLTLDTDPALLGGFCMYAEGRVYDYSFKNQLNHFYQQTVNEG